MKNIIKERFKLGYENDSAASYLVLSMNSNENILEYQVEMLNRNSCQGILRLDTRQKNDEIKLYYDITSTLTLAQFLQRKSLKEEEFVNILRGITKTLLNSREYFLYDGSFIIDEEYIYINPSTLDIYMIYLPLTLETDARENFKSFLINMIISSVKVDENSRGNYMQKILNYLKDGVFNISDFDNFLKGLKEVESQTSENRILGRNQLSSIQKPYVNRNREIKRIDSEKGLVKSITHKDAGLDVISKKNEGQEETRVKMIYEPKYIFIAVLSQLLIGIMLVLGLDTIRAAAGDDVSAYGGITIIVVAIDILLFKNLFKRENMKEVKVVKKSKVEKTRKKSTKQKVGKTKTKSKAVLSEESQSLNMSKREIYNVNDSANNTAYREAAVCEAQDLSINVNDTVILDEGEQGKAYLQRMSNGMMDKISIVKSNFIIGRLPNYVDHLIESNAIGRAHAEIIYREGKYFITDLNSKNGTFLNEAKIDSNKEYQINSGDKLKFANIKYTFFIS